MASSEDKPHIVILKEEYQKLLDERRIVYEKLTDSKLDKDSEFYKKIKLDAKNADIAVDEKLADIHQFNSTGSIEKEIIKSEEKTKSYDTINRVYMGQYEFGDDYDDDISDDINLQIALNESLNET